VTKILDPRLEMYISIALRSYVCPGRLTQSDSTHGVHGRGEQQRPIAYDLPRSVPNGIDVSSQRRVLKETCSTHAGCSGI
jgi:hypothetical protein